MQPLTTKRPLFSLYHLYSILFIMHGHLRSEYKARQVQMAAKLAQKAQHWHDLQDSLHTTTNNNSAAQVLAVTAKLLTLHPDSYSLWNCRRESWMQELPMLNAGCDSSSSDIEPEERRRWYELIQTELDLTQAALERNPKAYGAWLHRKIVLQKQIQVVQSPLQRELNLTALLLKRDERNFHCWNYRRFVIGLLLLQDDSDDAATGEWKLPGDQSTIRMGAQVVAGTATGAPCSDAPPQDTSPTTTSSTNILQQELDFTFQKIRDNFSNFSALDYRSKLLRLIQPADGAMNDDFAELDLVENAMFTEPDDQSAWWYQRFVLDYYQNNNSLWKERLDQHVTNLRQLAADSMESKWVWLGLHQALQAQDRINNNESNSSRAEQRAILQRLVELDPDRSERYKQLLEENYSSDSETE